MQSRVLVLEQILSLSEKQLNLVQLGDTTLLLELLARKQKMFETFETLEQQLDPYRNIEPQDRRWESEQERRDCETAILQCNELLAAVLELDQQSIPEFAQQKDEIQRKLKTMGTSGKAGAVYARQNIIPVSPKTLSPTRFDFTE